MTSSAWRIAARSLHLARQLRFAHEASILYKDPECQPSLSVAQLGIDVDDPAARAWMEAHLPEFRQQASGQRPWLCCIC